MEVAMRHGVLGYEAMGLSPAFFIFRFGVFIYEATRYLVVDVSEACAEAVNLSLWGFMAVLTRHARLLYLLALFQLLGGPLVLGGLMMVMKLTAEKEMTLSQSVVQKRRPMSCITGTTTILYRRRNQNRSPAR
jgi:hypothetical protein